MWYLIVSTPDLCTLTYFENLLVLACGTKITFDSLMIIFLLLCSGHPCAGPEGDSGVDPPTGKSQVAVGFLRNFGTDHHRASKRTSIPLSKKYVDD